MCLWAIMNKIDSWLNNLFPWFQFHFYSLSTSKLADHCFGRIGTFVCRSLQSCRSRLHQVHCSIVVEYKFDVWDVIQQFDIGPFDGEDLWVVVERVLLERLRHCRRHPDRRSFPRSFFSILDTSSDSCWNKIDVCSSGVNPINQKLSMLPLVWHFRETQSLEIYFW
jgi:hypothetical protein